MWYNTKTVVSLSPSLNAGWLSGKIMVDFKNFLEWPIKFLLLLTEAQYYYTIISAFWISFTYYRPIYLVVASCIWNKTSNYWCKMTQKAISNELKFKIFILFHTPTFVNYMIFKLYYSTQDPFSSPPPQHWVTSDTLDIFWGLKSGIAFMSIPIIATSQNYTTVK